VSAELHLIYDHLVENYDTSLTPLELAEMAWLSSVWVLQDQVGEIEQEVQNKGQAPQQSPQSTEVNEQKSSRSSQQEKREEKREEEVDASLTDPEASEAQKQTSFPSDQAVETLRTSTAVSIPLESPIQLSRALHRVAHKASSGQLELDLASTMRATAEAGGMIVLKQRRRKISATTLILIEDRSSHLMAFRDTHQQIMKRAEELGSFVRLHLLTADFNANELVFNRGDKPVKLSSLVRCGQGLRVILLTDGLGRRLRDGQLSEALLSLPQQTKVAWLHPWGELWHRTCGSLKIGRVKPLPGPLSESQSLALPIIPLSPNTLSKLESWSRGLGSKIGRKLPLSGQPSKKRKNRPEPQGAAEWTRQIGRVSSALTPEAMRLIACAAAVPGEGLDLELLTAIGERFVKVDSLIIRRVISEAITSGVLRRLERDTPERVVVGFPHLDARTAALSWIDKDGIKSVLEYLVERSYNAPLQHDLGIRLDLLLRAKGIDVDETLSESQQWNDSFEATVNVLKAAQVPFSSIERVLALGNKETDGSTIITEDTEHEGDAIEEGTTEDDELTILQNWLAAMEGYTSNHAKLPKGFLNEKRIKAYDAAQDLFSKHVDTFGLKVRKLNRSTHQRLFGYKILKEIPENDLGIQQSFVALLVAPFIWRLDPAGDPDIAAWNVDLGYDHDLWRLGVYVIYGHKLPRRTKTANRYRDPGFKKSLRQFMSKIGVFGKAQLFNLGTESFVGVFASSSSYEEFKEEPLHLLEAETYHFARLNDQVDEAGYEKAQLPEEQAAEVAEEEDETAKFISWLDKDLASAQSEDYDRWVGLYEYSLGQNLIKYFLFTESLMDGLIQRMSFPNKSLDLITRKDLGKKKQTGMGGKVHEISRMWKMESLGLEFGYKLNQLCEFSTKDLYKKSYLEEDYPEVDHKGNPIISWLEGVTEFRNRYVHGKLSFHFEHDKVTTMLYGDIHYFLDGLMETELLNAPLKVKSLKRSDQAGKLDIQAKVLSKEPQQINNCTVTYKKDCPMCDGHKKLETKEGYVVVETCGLCDGRGYLGLRSFFSEETTLTIDQQIEYILATRWAYKLNEDNRVSLIYPISIDFDQLKDLQRSVQNHFQKRTKSDRYQYPEELRDRITEMISTYQDSDPWIAEVDWLKVMQSVVEFTSPDQPRDGNKSKRRLARLSNSLIFSDRRTPYLFFLGHHDVRPEVILKSDQVHDVISSITPMRFRRDYSDYGLTYEDVLELLSNRLNKSWNEFGNGGVILNSLINPSSESKRDLKTQLKSDYLDKLRSKSRRTKEIPMGDIYKSVDEYQFERFNRQVEAPAHESIEEHEYFICNQAEIFKLAQGLPPKVSNQFNLLFRIKLYEHFGESSNLNQYFPWSGEPPYLFNRINAQDFWSTYTTNELEVTLKKYNLSHTVWLRMIKRARNRLLKFFHDTHPAVDMSFLFS
jgi:hypothetical protein